MSLEIKLSDNDVNEFINKYVDTVNQYGLGSKEQQEMYNSITKQHPEMKSYFKIINEVKDAFNKGIIN